MQIGVVPDPLNWDRWDEAKALLEPARVRDPEHNPMLEEHYLLWAVMDGDELLAAATARLTVENECEVILVGGRDHGRWLGELDRRIGAAARLAGANRMVACGRAGWAGSLKALGWDCSGKGRVRRYSRRLI